MSFIYELSFRASYYDQTHLDSLIFLTFGNVFFSSSHSCGLSKLIQPAIFNEDTDFAKK